MSIRNSAHDCIIDLHHRTTVRRGPSHSQTLGSVAVGVNQVSVGGLRVRVGVGVPTIRSTRVGSEDHLGSTFGLWKCDKTRLIQMGRHVANGD
jgi:hypothetical protein